MNSQVIELLLGVVFNTEQQLALERRFVAELAGLIERRTTLALSVTERPLYAEVAGRSLATAIVGHHIV